jgi:hypothetical protein
VSNKSKQTTTTTPTLDPAYGPLQKMILDRIMQRLQGSPSLSGYAATGIGDINRTYDLAGQNLENSLTARGLSTSPVAGAAGAKLQAGRAGSIAGFQNSLPLLLDSLRRQSLSDATGVLGFGRGSTTMGTTEAGGGAAGAFTNLAQLLGFLYGKGAFGQGAAAGGGGFPSMGAG